MSSKVNIVGKVKLTLSLFSPQIYPNKFLFFPVKINPQSRDQSHNKIDTLVSKRRKPVNSCVMFYWWLHFLSTVDFSPSGNLSLSMRWASVFVYLIAPHQNWSELRFFSPYFIQGGQNQGQDKMILVLPLLLGFAHLSRALKLEHQKINLFWPVDPVGT